MTPNPTYTDLEIRILAKEDEGYPVEITFNGDQEFPRGYFRPESLPWTSTGSPAADGEKLFTQLFADDRLKTAWAEVRGRQPQRRIRLRLDATAPELHPIPWELLRDPGDGSPAQDLAAMLATPFSRYLAGKSQRGSPILKRPIKMLVAIANPQNLQDRFRLPPLAIEQEWALLQEATAGLPGLEVTQLPQPCTLPALETALKEGYHILHFIGHGSYNLEQRQAVLFMANAANQVELVTDQQMAEMLARQLAETEVQDDDKLRLVFLASCQTASRSQADAFHGFAPRLVAAGVPAVLAMQDFISVDTARTFAQTFYNQLLRHGQVDLASNEARAALLTARKPGAAIPVLFMRLRSGLLFQQRGEFLDSQGESFWQTLLKNIADNECTPILGPGVTTEILPDLDDLAQALAAEHNYPFADRQNFPRVAQFVGTLDEVRLRKDVIQHLTTGFKKRMGLQNSRAVPEDTAAPSARRGLRSRSGAAPAKGLAETITAANWSERSQELLENELHHQLADLPLALYLTTNFDNFMTLALQAQGCQPRRERIGWRETQPTAASQPYYDLDPPPNLDQPVVLHLFGTEEDPSAMVLTEDNYLDYLARISRDHEHLLPTSVQKALAQTTLLFLGYRLEDLDLKVLMRGLLTQLDLKRWQRLRVAVQIEATPDHEERKQEIIQYFQNYFAASQEARIYVYWGSTHQFVADLHNRWQAYLEEADD